MKVRFLSSMVVLVSLSIPQAAHASMPKPSANLYEVSSYCNQVAVKHLYAMLEDLYAGQYIAVSDQYSILDEQFNTCLREEGDKLKKNSEVNLNQMMSQ